MSQFSASEGFSLVLQNLLRRRNNARTNECKRVTFQDGSSKNGPKGTTAHSSVSNAYTAQTQMQASGQITATITAADELEGTVLPKADSSPSIECKARPALVQLTGSEDLWLGNGSVNCTANISESHTNIQLKVNSTPIEEKVENFIASLVWGAADEGRIKPGKPELHVVHVASNEQQKVTHTSRLMEILKSKWDDNDGSPAFCQDKDVIHMQKIGNAYWRAFDKEAEITDVLLGRDGCMWYESSSPQSGGRNKGEMRCLMPLGCYKIQRPKPAATAAAEPPPLSHQHVLPAARSDWSASPSVDSNDCYKLRIWESKLISPLSTGTTLTAKSVGATQGSLQHLLLLLDENSGEALILKTSSSNYFDSSKLPISPTRSSSSSSSSKLPISPARSSSSSIELLRKLSANVEEDSTILKVGRPLDGWDLSPATPHPTTKAAAASVPHTAEDRSAQPPSPIMAGPKISVLSSTVAKGYLLPDKYKSDHVETGGAGDEKCRGPHIPQRQQQQHQNRQQWTSLSSPAVMDFATRRVEIPAGCQLPSLGIPLTQASISSHVPLQQLHSTVVTGCCKAIEEIGTQHNLTTSDICPMLLNKSLSSATPISSTLCTITRQEPHPIVTNMPSKLPQQPPAWASKLDLPVLAGMHNALASCRSSSSQAAEVSRQVVTTGGIESVHLAMERHLASNGRQPNAYGSQMNDGSAQYAAVIMSDSPRSSLLAQSRLSSSYKKDCMVNITERVNSFSYFSTMNVTSSLTTPLRASVGKPASKPSEVTARTVKSLAGKYDLHHRRHNSPTFVSSSRSSSFTAVIAASETATVPASDRDTTLRFAKLSLPALMTASPDHPTHTPGINDAVGYSALSQTSHMFNTRQ